MKPYYRFIDIHFDVLREVGNIGAGNAATALSQLLNQPIDMKVPNVKLLLFDDIMDALGGAEEVMLAVFLRVEGEAPSNMFFIIRQESAKRLLRSLDGIHVQEDESYSEMELSALSEIGNILAGSYLSALADFTSLHMYPTVPSIAIDMVGAVLSFGLLQYGAMGDHAILIDTSLFQGKQEVEGHFFLIPDPDSFKRIFDALGVPAE